MDDLVEREGLFYQKFTNIPFDGQVSGMVNGSFVKGRLDGNWTSYFSDGQLREVGMYIDGNRDGVWKTFYQNIRALY